MASYEDLAPDASGPDGSFLGKYYCRLLVGRYTRTRPFATSSWRPTNAIFLPIPKDLNDETFVNYSEENLQGIGDLINIDPGAFVGRVIFGEGAGILAEKALKAGFNAGGPVAAALGPDLMGATGVTATNITSAIQNVTGYVPNPNPAVLFTGPDLREFTFTWSLYPKTEDESRHIDKTIKLLKRAALPRPWTGKSTGVLEYPALCQMNFFPWDAGGGNDSWGWTDNSIIRMKKCFMKNVRVHYSDFGNPAFFEGTNLPVMYRLSITLQETEYMLANDWDEKLNSSLLDKATASVVDATLLASKAVAGTLSDLGVGPDLFSNAAETGAEGADPQ